MSNLSDFIPGTGLRNRVINGAFDVWQRGTSFASGAAQYGPDRWQVYRGSAASGATFSQTPNTNVTGTYYLKLARNSGNTSTAIITAATSFETIENYKLLGKTVTISCTLIKGANFSGSNVVFSLIYGTGTDGNLATGFTGQTNVTTVTIPAASISATELGIVFQATGTIPTNATQLGIQISWTPVGTAGVADWVGVGQVQLELGAVVNPFDQRLYGLEFALCQRYYQIGYGYLAGYTAASTTVSYNYSFPVAMRIAPSSIINSGQLNINTTGANFTSADTRSATMFATGVAAGGFICQSTGAFSAEL